jgi:4-hydroxybenzoate polyprenyltransferase
VGAFFKLIRIKNLIMILATMYLLKYMVINSWLNAAMSDWGINGGMTDGDFLLLALSVVCVAAAGYIINDYFDISIDRINHPDTSVVGVTIGKDKALILHFIFNIIGIGLGFWCASRIGYYKLGFTHAIIAAGLWFYSSTFKRELLIGNVIVSLATAMVPAIVGLFEIPLLIEKFQKIAEENKALFYNTPELETMINSNLHGITRFILIGALFCFLLNMSRELIKDMEDMEGDAAFGCKTLPLVAGVRVTKITIVGILLIVILMLGYIMYYQVQSDKVSFVYFLLALFLPVVFLVYKIYKAADKKQFAFASMINKGIMSAGIFYTLVYNYLLKHGS